MKKLVLIDCDSTLSSIEGVDEMARLRGPDIGRQIEEMTADAMDGKIPLERIFGARLELVRPSREETASIGRQYIETVEPHAHAAIQRLQSGGWEVAIVSGGYRQAIRPLADFLGIDRVEAVDLHFASDGAYDSFDADYPTSRSGGKCEIAEKLRSDGFETIVMVGDGVSDLEAREAVDLFVGFGGFVVREKVKAEADRFIYSFEDLPAIAEELL